MYIVVNSFDVVIIYLQTQLFVYFSSNSTISTLVIFILNLTYSTMETSAAVPKP